MAPRALLPTLLLATLVAGFTACGDDGGGPSGPPGGGDTAADAAGGGPADATDGGDAAAGPGDGTAVDTPAPTEVVVEEADGLVVLTNGPLVVSWDLAAGTFDVGATGGGLHLARAEARVTLSEGGEETSWGTSAAGTRTWESTPFADKLGTGMNLIVRHDPAGGGPEITARVHARLGATWLTLEVEARWPGGAPDGARLARLSPLVVDGETDGALFVGVEPVDHRMLDNGSDLYFDFEAQLQPPTWGTSLLFGPGASSNWNLALYDPLSGASLVAGFFSATRGAGLFGVDHSPAAARTDEGRTGFTRFEALSYYLDGRAPLADDESGDDYLVSELLYVDFAPEDVFEGLESFARRYAQRIDKVVRTDIPTGWNSWGGGAGSGGYGTDIDEALMLANLDAAAADFLPFGMRYFMIDDGWQVADGDWLPRPDRFPGHDGVDGMKWLADEIRARGMTPGLWISPYTVDDDSQLAAEHPDWFAETGAFGTAVVPSDILVLDLTHPEVLAFLGETFERIAVEWGYEWIKMDFSYYALFNTGMHDPDVTPTEAYRAAFDVLREAIGPQTFLLTVSATGLCFDSGDGHRLTLDNEPWWGITGTGEQGMLSTYLTMSRRYYLGHTLWVNHPDLLFWRPDYGLTLEEARAFVSAVAMTGGIVKLGDSYLDLHDHPEWREQVYPLLPVYPKTGRPLDLFDRELAEVWSLHAERIDRSWRVIGLFHWGQNRDIGETTWEPEVERTHTVALADHGLDPTQRHLVIDSWEQTWRWVEGETFTETLQPRSARVLIVRQEPADPAIVHTSRHLMGGAVEVHEEFWSQPGATLEARLDAIPGRPLTVLVAAPGRELASVGLKGGLPGAMQMDDGVLSITIDPDAFEVELELELPWAL